MPTSSTGSSMLTSADWPGFEAQAAAPGHGSTPSSGPARFGLALAVAAVAVNAPRLILAFLEAEGVATDARWRLALLALTGISTGIVLTGGGALLAHAVAHCRHFRKTLAVTWVLVLVSTGILITPMLTAGLLRVPLPEVLGTSALRWTWSAVAVLAVELVAAGSMIAFAAHRRAAREDEQAELELFELARERNELARERDELRAELELEQEERQQLELELAARQLSPSAEPASSSSATASSGAASSQASSSQASSSAPAEESIPCRNGCGRVFASSHAERGHQRSCPLATPS